MSTGVGSGKPSGNPVDAILTAEAAWMRAYAAKDLEKSLACRDEQGSMLAPNSPIATGKDALAKLIASAFTIPDFKLSWHPNNVGVARSGEQANTSGSYDLSFKDASGKTLSDKGST